MPTIITQRELRNDSADIMRRLEAGESFIITRHGKQIGKLTPIHRSQFTPVDEVIAAFKSLPRVPRSSYAQLRADLDRHADQDPTPRTANE